MSKSKIHRVKGGVTAAKGFLAAGVRCGLKSRGSDLAIIFSKNTATTAAVFTKNPVCAAPIQVCRKHLRDKKCSCVVVNAGNANACTGEEGLENAFAMAEMAANNLKINPEDVLVASTGIIGHQLNMEKIAAGITLAAKNLKRSGSEDAARSIMTTDLVPKSAALKMMIGDNGVVVKMGGITKGSGMIHPNMATMLGFITTDAAIDAKCLKRALKDAVDDSFNMITVDGDTSTNDTVIIMANGKAGNATITDPRSESYKVFAEALKELSLDLARQIAADGEGATCLVRIEVDGAKSKSDARKVAKSVAGSNLVKTAIFGRDPNWGRILCAVGYSGAAIDPNKVNLWIGNVQTVEKGAPIADFNEAAASEALKQKEVAIRISLGVGKAFATAYTCDLTYDYVKINAEYHT